MLEIWQKSLTYYRLNQLLEVEVDQDPLVVERSSFALVDLTALLEPESVGKDNCKDKLFF